MRTAVISDIHANSDAVAAVFAAYLIYDDGHNSIEFRRVAYDPAPCLGRAARAGLLRETRTERLWRRVNRRVADINRRVTSKDWQ